MKSLLPIPFFLGGGKDGWFNLFHVIPSPLLPCSYSLAHCCNFVITGKKIPFYRNNLSTKDSTQSHYGF